MGEPQLRSGCLALADGTVFPGKCFGWIDSAGEPACGEVVFNTSMFGYQEILTDPSYAGQMICFTSPHIGNVGCNEEDNESGKVHPRGMIVRSLTWTPSNFRSKLGLNEYLEKNRVVGIAGLDTRALVLHLRQGGVQIGAIGVDCSPDDLISAAKSAPALEEQDLVREVSCQEPFSWRELPWQPGVGYEEVSDNALWARPHLVAIDCGIKRNILRLLTGAGFRVTVVPADSTAESIDNLQPQAIFLSNGPGDPATADYVVETAKRLLGRYPIFGICLGHQIIARALGGNTYKLKFGHRGGNHPVIELATGRVHITVQNHGYAVGQSDLQSNAAVSHINLNDDTVAGLEVPELKAFCVQYHPEASPGPQDSLGYFERFYDRVTNGWNVG